jgi:hypothetical protein
MSASATALSPAIFLVAFISVLPTHDELDGAVLVPEAIASVEGEAAQAERFSAEEINTLLGEAQLVDERGVYRVAASASRARAAACHDPEKGPVVQIACGVCRCQPDGSLLCVEYSCGGPFAS